MGQKVNPHGLRVGVIKDWNSRWTANKKSFGDVLVEDYKIRQYLNGKTYKAEKSGIQIKPGIANVEIERDAASRIKVLVHTSKPGILIGQKGAEIEAIRTALEKITKGKPINLNVIEVKDIDLNAQLVAENVAAQLEQRASFRRAMKSVIGRAMKAGAMGIKTMVSGRLGGAEIARTEHYHEGTMPLHTLRADIDYGVARANTTYGVIGVKVWVYKGEVLKGEVGANKRIVTQQQNERPKRRPDNRGGYNRDNRNSGGYGYNRDSRPGGYNRDNRNGGGHGGYNRDNRVTRPQGERTHFNPNAGNTSRPNALAPQTLPENPNQTPASGSEIKGGNE